MNQREEHKAVGTEFLNAVGRICAVENREINWTKSPFHPQNQHYDFQQQWNEVGAVLNPPITGRAAWKKFKVLGHKLKNQLPKTTHQMYALFNEVVHNALWEEEGIKKTVRVPKIPKKKEL